jgi:hypothetical protein
MLAKARSIDIMSGTRWRLDRLKKALTATPPSNTRNGTFEKAQFLGRSTMAKKKDLDDDQLMDDFDEDSSLEFEQGEELDFAGEDDLLLEEGEEDEDLSPSVLYKGVSRPKTDDDWRQLLMEAKSDGVPEYQLAGNYREGELLSHSRFGLGVVTKVITPRKIEVIFETSKKLMAMNVATP